jgi:hypothetical protein
MSPPGSCVADTQVSAATLGTRTRFPELEMPPLLAALAAMALDAAVLLAMAVAE